MHQITASALEKTAQFDKLNALYLQGEASACVSGLENVLFCGVAVSLYPYLLTAKYPLLLIS